MVCLCVVYTQEHVSRLVEAHDVRLSEMESEASERARQAREVKNELQVCVTRTQAHCTLHCTAWLHTREVKNELQAQRD